jgi:hypothetical protein
MSQMEGTQKEDLRHRRARLRDRFEGGAASRPVEISLDRELPNIRLERSGSTPAAQPGR